MLTIEDTWMSSDISDRVAVQAPDGWVVSWLPDRTLNRNDAISAMTLAELVADGGPGHLVRHYAAELDVPAADAIRLINGQPQQLHDAHAIGDDAPDPLTALALLHRPEQRMAGVHGQEEPEIYGICVHCTTLANTADPSGSYEITWPCDTVTAAGLDQPQPPAVAVPFSTESPF